MKKIYFLLSFVFIAKLSFAQWTTNGNNIYNSNTGNVGIGTTNLPAKFNVFQSIALGTAAQNFSLLSTISGEAGTNMFENNIWLVRSSIGSDWYSTGIHDGISIDASFQNPQVNTLTWWERDPGKNLQSWGNGNSTYLSINNGNVGIGTVDNSNWQLASSTYKLAVNGSIIATAMTVKLNANWPDYVFKKEYHLQPLDQLQAFVNQYHRLPDMPSEKEVAKNGINLGDIDKLLTKKVEELTMYLLEKDEQVKSQQIKIENQEQSIAQQAQQLHEQQNEINKQNVQLEKMEIKLNALLKSQNN
ncbi:hypothetical protein HDF19_13265 [Mucilaginibacter sp. E4BP6]|uniref:hypothetical protein n=1 Tax=Mucilaginibacter sp. E4BP6 TaxID=2723089 RepID=UPI0015C87D51|nr:hypothetical protein [Mucilaginibacter sp. E4BP6]NYE66051.1 putative coiled-coil protein SlyX [Mucilaginibacter sp. E4BP6]